MKLLMTRSVDYLQEGHDFWNEALLLSFPNEVPSGSITLERHWTSLQLLSPKFSCKTILLNKQVRGKIDIFLI